MLPSGCLAHPARAPVRCGAAPPTRQPSERPTVVETNVKTGSRRSVDMKGGVMDGTSDSGSVAAAPAPLAAARSLFLPQGFPHSVTDDYLAYQLWSFPTHITGWMSSCEI